MKLLATVLTTTVVVFHVASPTVVRAQDADLEMLRRTPHGDPDISGTFTFRTLTPLNRPATLEGQETLSEEEAAAFESAERRRLNRDLFDPETGQPTAGYQSRAEGGVLSTTPGSFPSTAVLTERSVSMPATLVADGKATH